MKPRSPEEGILIDATPHACPYLPDRIAVLPTRWYPEPIDPSTFDDLLARSDRRVGQTLYRPSCPSCKACIGIRIPLADFEPSKSQRKILKQNEDIRITVGPPAVDSRRLALFNRHKLERGLAHRPTSIEHYANWLAQSCVQTVEINYWLEEQLVGVGIVDLGAIAASSAYFYFDPDESSRSLGTFSVLHEAQWLKERGLRFYYLGLWIEECPSMAYKNRFHPHEILVDGEWVRIED